MNLFWRLVNWSLKNKHSYKWNLIFNQTTFIFIQKIFLNLYAKYRSLGLWTRNKLHWQLNQNTNKIKKMHCKCHLQSVGHLLRRHCVRPVRLRVALGFWTFGSSWALTWPHYKEKYPPAVARIGPWNSLALSHSASTCPRHCRQTWSQITYLNAWWTVVWCPIKAFIKPACFPDYSCAVVQALYRQAIPCLRWVTCKHFACQYNSGSRQAGWPGNGRRSHQSYYSIYNTHVVLTLNFKKFIYVSTKIALWFSSINLESCPKIDSKDIHVTICKIMSIYI